MQIDLAISDYLLYLQTCGKANKTIVSYASDLNIYAKFLEQNTIEDIKDVNEDIDFNSILDDENAVEIIPPDEEML